GPVYNLAETMTKFLAIGHSLEKVIQAVTETPAQMIGKSNLGRLEKGKAADLTFFTIDDKNVELQDSFGHVKQTNKIITPHAVMIKGEYMECRTNEVIRSDYCQWYNEYSRCFSNQRSGYLGYERRSGSFLYHGRIA